MSTGNKSQIKNQKSKGGQVIFYITDGGRRLAEKIAKQFSGSEILRFNSGSFKEKWRSSKDIICIMAAGIVVRSSAPLLKDKMTDPAVVVLDEKGEYVISLLSGHIGGANALTKKIAECLGAHAVITTASDVQGKTALDLWAAEQNLHVENYEKMKMISAKIVNGKKVKIKIDAPLDNFRVSEEFVEVDTVREAHVVISCRLYKKDALFLRPKVLSVGIGCNRGTKKKEIADVLAGVFEREKLSLHSIKNLATIDLKKDEKGLIEFAHDKDLVVDFYTKDELNNTVSEFNIKGSGAVRSATGAEAVAEPSAMLAAEREFGNAVIITGKQKRGNVTLAIAQAKYML